MSIKITKETDLQRDLINECKKMGGFGDKIQDKYIRGKSDIWLKLPSGLLVFTEIKIVRNVRYTIAPEFKTLQLEYMEALTLNHIPVVGITFAQSPEGFVDFKVSSYMELKALFERHHKIKYHISHFERARSFKMVIEAIEGFFVGSEPQIVRTNTNIVKNFFSEAV